MAAIHVDELVRALLVEGAHLLDEPGAADSCEQNLVRDLAVEHGARRVLERSQDHPAGVDQRAVEIEENDREAHCS